MRRDRNEFDRTESSRFFLLIVGVFVFAMCILSYYLYNERSNIHSIKLTQNGIVNAELDTNFGTLLPGQSSEYRIELECKEEGTYKFTFIYEEKEQSPLGKYVTVELNIGEETVRKNLGELFVGSELVATQTFAQAIKTSFTINYIMNDDVGDEAQGAVLDFSLKLMVKKIA